MELWTEPTQTWPVQQFLRSQGLEPDPEAEFTVSLRQDSRILACGSLDGNVIKGMAVDPAFRGQGLAARLMTSLRQAAFRQGRRKLFVYTKPENELLFRGLGFFPLATAGEAMLLENVRGGLQAYLDNLDKHSGPCGAVVMNCAPFTNGHRYLVEQAAGQCAWLYVFVLSEEKGMFSAAQRLDMVRRGCRAYANVSVHPTDGYLISNATFPTYFLKDRWAGGETSCQLDVEMFAGRFAPALDLKLRFLGTEPADPVTRAYNETLKALLPPRGIGVQEIPRLTQQGVPVSASRVRSALHAGRWAEVQALVPETTFDALTQQMGG